MERLVCEGSCPFKRMCGVMANQKGVFCGDEIKSVLKATDLEADGKYKVNGSVSTSKGAVPVGRIIFGNAIKKVEQPKVLATAAV